MKVTDIPTLIEGVCLQKNFKDIDIKTVYCSDLLSDVLANAPEYSILVTVQAHQNTVAVSSMKEIPAIIVCNNRECPEDMVQSAFYQNIGVFLTPLNQFTVSGRLYSAMNLTSTNDYSS